MHHLFRIFSCLFVLVLAVACSRDKTAGDILANTNPGITTNDKALDAATAAIEQDPANATNFKRRAGLYLDRKQYNQAIEDIDRAIAIDSTKGDFYFVKSQALRGKSQVPAALKIAHKAEQKGFSDAGLFLSMGEMYLILKQYQKSIDYLNKSLEKAQFNEQAYFYKGLVYAESGDTTRAISSFQTAIEQEPSYTDSYNALIKIYNAKNDRKMASQYLKSALRFAPDDPFLLFNKGIFLRAEGKPDSAMMAFQQAIFFDSTMYLAHYNLGTVAYQKENYQLAATSLQKALDVNSELPAVEALLAYSYEQTGNLDRAEYYYTKASEENPADKEIIAGFKRVKAKKAAQATSNP